MFEKAVRNKYRFNVRGLCDVEDLWDLSLTELDKLHSTLVDQKDASKGKSLLVKQNKEDDELVTKIAIVRYIVEVKIQEGQEREQRASDREKKQQLLGILAQKQNQELMELSSDELKALIENM